MSNYVEAMLKLADEHTLYQDNGILKVSSDNFAVVAFKAIPELRALLAERDALREQEQKLNAQLTEQKAEIKLLEEFFTHSPHCNYWDSDFDEDGELVESGTEYVCNCQWDTNAEQISILRNELKSILSAEANGERR